jgi:hypothetical protein
MYIRCVAKSFNLAMTSLPRPLAAVHSGKTFVGAETDYNHISHEVDQQMLYARAHVYCIHMYVYTKFI